MPGILLKHIAIEPSLVIPGSATLTIECSRGFKYTGNFALNDLMHFCAAVSEALKFYGAAYGRTETKDGVTRMVRP